MGIFAAICPMYLVELAPPQLQGTFGSFAQLFVTLGNLFVFIFGIFENWKQIAFTTLALPALQIILLFTIPDSSVQEGNTEHESIFQKKFLAPFLHSVFFMFCQQFSGINPILTNMNNILGDSGIMKSTTASVVVNIFNLFGTLGSSLIIEKLGRKPTWIISSFGLTIGLLLSWLEGLLIHNSYVSFGALCLYMIFFGVGFGPVPWLIVPELFPDSVRSIFCSICTFLNWIFAASITYLWPVMADAIQPHWGFFIFAGVCLLSAMYGIFFMPETKVSGDSELLYTLIEPENK